MTDRSVTQLRTCAARHVSHYTRPGSGRAFHVYDRLGDPDSLEPVDLLAPALLDARLDGRLVIAMYGEQGPYSTLRTAMEALLADPASRSARFEEQDLDAPSGPWALVQAVLRASDDTKAIKAAKVTKVLHRKRPLLVPIFDSEVAAFYGVTTRRPWSLWPTLQAELRDHGPWLRSLAGDLRTPDGREVSTLRILDIVVWEHRVTG